jgi:hypothetical protein
MASVVSWIKKKVKRSPSAESKRRTALPDGVQGDRSGDFEYEEFISEDSRTKARRVRKQEVRHETAASGTILPVSFNAINRCQTILMYIFIISRWFPSYLIYFGAI